MTIVVPMWAVWAVAVPAVIVTILLAGTAVWMFMVMASWRRDGSR